MDFGLTEGVHDRSPKFLADKVSIRVERGEIKIKCHQTVFVVLTNQA